MTSAAAITAAENFGLSYDAAPSAVSTASVAYCLNRASSKFGLALTIFPFGPCAHCGNGW